MLREKSVTAVVNISQDRVGVCHQRNQVKNIAREDEGKGSRVRVRVP